MSREEKIRRIVEILTQADDREISDLILDMILEILRNA